MKAKNRLSNNQQIKSLKNKGKSSGKLSQPRPSKTPQQDSCARGLRYSLPIDEIIYQIKLLMLFLEIALDFKYEFKLYSEKEDAEKFDDVIFQYSRDGQYRFLQAKYESNLKYKITFGDLCDNPNPFHLQKYFESFRKLEQQSQYKEKIKDFIICTNTDFKDDIKKRRLIKMEEHDDILNIGGKRYTLDLSRNKDIIQKLKASIQKNIIYDKVQHGIEGQLSNKPVSDDEIERFFEKLVFAVEQPDEKKLSEKLIDSKIFNWLDDLKNIDDLEFMYRIIDDLEFMYHIEKQILNWLQKSENIAFSNRDDFFKKGREKITIIMSYFCHLKYSSFIEGLNINFNSKCKEIRDIADFLISNDKILNFIAFQKGSHLSQIKMYQIIRQEHWHLQKLLSLQDDNDVKVKSLFNHNLLIIVCKDEYFIKCSDINYLYDELVDSIREDQNNKIILVTENNSILASCFKEDFKNNYREISDMIRVEDLRQSCLQEKLLQKRIIFQGREISLADVMNIGIEKLYDSELQEEEIQKLKRILKPEVLGVFLSNTNIIVGTKLPDFTDSSSPYYDPYHIDILHTFSQSIISIHSLIECIKEKKEDLFVFPFTVTDYVIEIILGEAKEIKKFSRTDNISDKEFFKGRFFMLSNECPEREFKEICNNNKGKNIHWLDDTCYDNRFTVKYSNNLINLYKFTEMEISSSMEFTEMEYSSVVIIVGCAGVGKSTVLTTYSQKLDPLSWTIRINLKDHQEYIKKANFNDLEGIIEFLCESNLVGLETALAKNFLKYYLENKQKIILLLDGYDEITDDSQENINQLLKFFKNMEGTERRIWLTTRLSEQHKIENALGTFAFSYFLNPFKKTEQEDFLKQYWIKKLNVKESDNNTKNLIHKFIKKLLKYFNQLGLMEKDVSIGIALQARMIAEIFHPKLKSKSIEVGINNILDLYDKFIEHQYNRYFTEKLNTYMNHLGKGLKNVLIDSYTKAHGYLALNALFPEEKLYKELLEDHVYHVFSQHDLNSIGIITNFKDNYIADFAHLTYAEYFIAKLSVHMLGKNKDHPKFKLIQDLLIKNLSLGRNTLIRTFLEYEIQKIPNHENMKRFGKIRTFVGHEIQKRCNHENIKTNWEMIQDLLGEVETKRISLFNLTSIKDSDTSTEIQYDVEFNKTLSDFRKDIESCMNWNCNCIDVDHNTSNIHICHVNRFRNLISKLIKRFLKETDVEELNITLEFLIKVYQNSIICDINLKLLLKEYVYNAVQHYLTQAKLQDKLNSEFEKECFGKKIYELNIDRKSIQNFTYMLDKLIIIRNSHSKIQKTKHLEDLMYCLFPECEYHIENFGKLNNDVYYLFNTFDKSAINHFNSIRYIKNKYKDRILTFLENTKFNVHGNTLSELLERIDVKYLQSFVIDIIHHPSIIARTELSINEIYQRRKHNIDWLMNVGILISRFLKTLTSEMSEIFIYAMTNCNINDICITSCYHYNVFYDFIIYIMHTLETEELPQINKLAFFKMTAYFADIFIKNNPSLPFMPNHLKTTLMLLEENIIKEDMLRKQDLFYIREGMHTNEVLESIKYLCVLQTAGLEFIDIADQEILIRDPASGLQLVFVSNNYKAQIMELLKYYKRKVNEWKYEHPINYENEFRKKCCEVARMVKE